MRLGTVIGTVTLSKQDPALRGARFLLVQPLTRAHYARTTTGPSTAAATVVVYDSLGAGRGQLVGFVEGAEAAVPFDHPTPVDAFNTALVDHIYYFPPT
jgi:microcompartment protein CcmK/EutM